MTSPALLAFWMLAAGADPLTDPTTTDPPFIRSRADPNDDTSACLHWTAGSLVMRQSTAGDSDVSDHSEFAAVSRAISNWKQEFDRCSDLALTEGLRTSSRRVGYLPGANDNENVMLFRQVDCLSLVAASDPCWAGGTCGNTYDCWEHSGGTIALTTTSYDPSTGRLFDADVEGNAASFFFTTVDSPVCPVDAPAADCVAFDVENTFTHEMGHVVGLAHTQFPGSTMNPSAPEGEISKRSIDPGSLSFVCEAYPRSEPATDCLAPPRQVDGTSFSCDAAPGGGLALLGLAAAVAGLTRRARATLGAHGRRRVL